MTRIRASFLPVLVATALLGVLAFPVYSQPETAPPGLDKIEEVLEDVQQVRDDLEEKASDLIEKATEAFLSKIDPATAEETIGSATGPEGSANERPVVYLLPIKGEVRPIMMTLFKRGVEVAEEANADLILLDMDTPGGQVNIAEEISETLLECEVPTATFIENEGLSAGMMIAISTQKLYLKDIALVGDCQPIFMGGGEIEEAPEKVLTVVRQYGERAAEKNGYPIDAVLAMIDEEIDYESADGEIKAPTGKLLTLRGTQAVQIGFAKGLANSTDEALEQMGLANAEVRKFKMNWAERLAAFIASPAVASLLTLIGMIGLFIEYKTPGFGLFGGIGLVCLALVFWGHSIAHLAGLEGALIFSAGVILLAVEVFVIPGFGIFGGVGIVAIFVGLLMTFLTVPIRNPLFMPELHLTVPLLMVTGSGVGALAGIFLLLWWLPEVEATRRLGLTLATELKHSDGYASFDDARPARLVGRVGVTVSPLRPGGIATFDGDRVDVVTSGDFIDSGARVRVSGVEGVRVIVEPERQETL